MKDLSVGSKEWEAFIIDGAKTMGIFISCEQAGQISIHCNELLQWNKKVNLTSITEPVDVAVRHVLDSLMPVDIIPNDASVLDIGSGNGFPGILLKIIRPDIQIALIDSSRKKTNFLKYVIRSLGLKNIEAINNRTENLSTDMKYANSFRVVISRSFSSLDKLVLSGVSFLSEKGMIIALKGKNAKEEVKMLCSISEKGQTKSKFSLKGYSLEIIPYVLPYAEIERFMIVLKRI